ncbi:MAG TPA: LLM class flavin-dependent oxidoreductase, partial [Chloroflexota bacterium]|nr:LLM class flavin-dependent oxidoreductase [Chloroflexota bacterium]
MQVGVSVPNFSRLGTREAVVEIAQQAEALGYDSIWTTDHVMVQKGQEIPYGHILEALTTLSYLAALTQRVRLGTSVIVFPQRNPVL